MELYRLIVVVAMKKLLLAAFLADMISCGLVFVDCVHFSVAQTSTNVSGVINSNTSFTQANSPYNLTGSMDLAGGATLTVESDVTVDLNGHHITILNGTLNAVGDSIVSDNAYLISFSFLIAVLC